MKDDPIIIVMEVLVILMIVVAVLGYGGIIFHAIQVGR